MYSSIVASGRFDVHLPRFFCTECYAVKSLGVNDLILNNFWPSTCTIHSGKMSSTWWINFIPVLVILLTLFIFYSYWFRPKMSPFHLTSNLFLKCRLISGMLLFDAQVLELYSSMKNEMPGISCRGFLQSLCLISRKNNRVCCYVC